MRSSSLRVLRHRDFRLMTLGGVVSQIGTWAQYVGAGWAASELSESTVVITATFAAQFLPSLFLSPVAGVVADRFDRKRLVIVGNLGMAIPPLAIGLLVQADRLEIWSLIALIAAGGVGLAITNPAAMAIAPDLVPADEIAVAVGTSSALMNLTRVVGPGIGGLAIQLWGVAWSFHLNAISFLAVVFAAAMIRLRHTPRPPATEAFTERFRRGLAYSRANRAVGRTLMIVLVVGYFTMHAPLMPVIARDVLDGDIETYAKLAAAPGFGAVLGAIVGGRPVVGATRRRMIAAAMGLVAIAFLVVSVSRSVPLTFAALVLYGLAFFLNNVVVTTLLMQVTADEYRGRVMGLFGMLQIGMIPLGAISGGFVSKAIGVPLTVALNAAGVGGYVAWLVASGRLRDIDTPVPPTPPFRTLGET